MDYNYLNYNFAANIDFYYNNASDFSTFIDYYNLNI